MSDHSLARSPRTESPHEQRKCRSCYGTGRILCDAEYDPTTGELTQETTACFICSGSRSVSVYLYVAPRRRA